MRLVGVIPYQPRRKASVPFLSRWRSGLVAYFLRVVQHAAFGRVAMGREHHSGGRLIGQLAQALTPSG